MSAFLWQLKPISAMFQTMCLSTKNVEKHIRGIPWFLVEEPRSRHHLVTRSFGKRSATVCLNPFGLSVVCSMYRGECVEDQAILEGFIKPA